jgi:hypothetical protein
LAQRTGLTAPRPLRFFPPLRRFLVMLGKWDGLAAKRTDTARCSLLAAAGLRAGGFAPPFGEPSMHVQIRLTSSNASRKRRACYRPTASGNKREKVSQTSQCSPWFAWLQFSFAVFCGFAAPLLQALRSGRCLPLLFALGQPAEQSSAHPPDTPLTHSCQSHAQDGMAAVDG